MTLVGWCPGGRPVTDMLKTYPGTGTARIFVGKGKPIPTWDGPVLGPLVAAGVKVVHLSVKDPDWPAVRRLIDAKPAGLLLILTFGHEPEQGTKEGDLPIDQWRARWAELVALLADHPARGELLLVPVYTRVWWERNAGDRRWMLDLPVDAIGWDIYSSALDRYRTPDDLLTIPRAVAEQTGLPYLVPELGAVRIASDKDGSGQQGWMRAMVDAVKGDGALTCCWFHKDGWDLLADGAEAARQTWQTIITEEAPGLIVSGIKFVAGRNDYGDRDGTKYGIAIHNTSNTASAANEASYATRRTDGTSSHFYCDDTEVIQSLDTKYRAGHAGSYEGNEHAVAVEITGTNDKTRAWWIANVAWDQLGRVLAAVCRKYDIEPRRASVAEMKANPRVRAFYSHDDMRRAWGGTTHTDPGGNFPWDHLFTTVKAHLSGTVPAPTPQEDDMPLTETDANTVWSAKAMEYVDERGDGARDVRTVKDILFATHAAAVAAANPAGLAKAVAAELRADLSELPAGTSVTVEQVEGATERAIRKVLGSVANTTR